MTLNQTVLTAVMACNNPDLEEEGGIILRNTETGEYQFIKLTNINTGQPLAAVLWTANREEYAKQVIPLFKDGWQHAASFHTHPNFPPFPSGIDLFNLFPGFPLNFIYSPKYDAVVGYAPGKEDSPSAAEVVHGYRISPDRTVIAEAKNADNFVQELQASIYPEHELLPQE